MRTIYYNDEDIKKCKLALVNQNLTSLQSAFLKQYINNLEYELQQKEDIINKIEDYLIKNNLFSYKYDEEELYEIVTDDKARTDLLKILDNKGDEK